jgi:hypothetical protein
MNTWLKLLPTKSKERNIVLENPLLQIFIRINLITLANISHLYFVYNFMVKCDKDVPVRLNKHFYFKYLKSNIFHSVSNAVADIVLHGIGKKITFWTYLFQSCFVVSII